MWNIFIRNFHTVLTNGKFFCHNIRFDDQRMSGGWARCQSDVTFKQTNFNKHLFSYIWRISSSYTELFTWIFNILYVIISSYNHWWTIFTKNILVDYFLVFYSFRLLLMLLNFKVIPTSNFLLNTIIIILFLESFDKLIHLCNNCNIMILSTYCCGFQFPFFFFFLLATH